MSLRLSAAAECTFSSMKYAVNLSLLVRRLVATVQSCKTYFTLYKHVPLFIKHQVSTAKAVVDMDLLTKVLEVILLVVSI